VEKMGITFGNLRETTGIKKHKAKDGRKIMEHYERQKWA
jgi:hypothetical protein